MILRTDELGTIQAVSDGKTVTFTWENQSENPGKRRDGGAVPVYRQPKVQEIPFPGLRQSARGEEFRGIFLLSGGH